MNNKRKREELDNGSNGSNKRTKYMDKEKDLVQVDSIVIGNKCHETNIIKSVTGSIN